MVFAPCLPAERPGATVPYSVSHSVLGNTPSAVYNTAKVRTVGS